MAWQGYFAEHESAGQPATAHIDLARDRLAFAAFDVSQFDAAVRGGAARTCAATVVLPL